MKVWRNDGRLVDLAGAQADPLPAAAANWLALATFAGCFAPRGQALLIDVGSTTTDIVPLLDGKPVPRGRTDPERLRCGELAYTGVMRTPLCAVLGARGAAELFATTRDVFLLLGRLPEDPSDCDTADGRPATREFARARLARMLGADATDLPESEIQRFAKLLAGIQRVLIQNAVRAAMSEPVPLIISGSGSFLARMLQPDVIDLTERIGAEASSAACAVASQIVSAIERSDLW